MVPDPDYGHASGEGQILVFPAVAGSPIALLSIIPLCWEARGGQHPPRQNPGLVGITTPLARGFWCSRGE